MDRNEYRTLQLLETIDGAMTPPSQRDLAKSLDMSLGLVNTFLRRLAKKGYFKVTHLPRNRIGYILTPTGMAEKSRLTYAYVLSSYRYFKSARGKFQRVFQELEKEGVKRIAFYGAGELAEIGISSLKDSRIGLSGVYDPRGNGQAVMGHPVSKLERADRVDFERILVTTSEEPASVVERLEAAGIPKGKILFL